MAASDSQRLLVQIASYNTNLQGNLGLPQDLVDWLSPTLQVSSFLSRELRAPDIVAVGFQELLPLHLGLAGLSKPTIESRDKHILSQIESHAPNKERYSLIAKVVNVGVALLVYGRDDGIARHVTEVQTQWTGCGIMYMGNKGAVGVRFRADGEVFTFVCAHLSAHEHLLERRVQDYNHIVSTLLFPPSSPSAESTTIYSTSHLFFFGDLNFRLALPPSHALAGGLASSQAGHFLAADDIREQLKEYDQLTVEHRKGSCFVGLREGDFWRFKCSYKFQLGEVDRYSATRIPSWTDRILYGTYTDDPEAPNESRITNLLYTSIPSYTTSDHKPIVSLLLLPRPSAAAEIPLSSSNAPLLRLPSSYTLMPSRHATALRLTGRTIGYLVGYVWWFLIVLGAGNTAVGIVNFILGIGTWTWWRREAGNPLAV